MIITRYLRDKYLASLLQRSSHFDRFRGVKLPKGVYPVTHGGGSNVTISQVGLCCDHDRSADDWRVTDRRERKREREWLHVGERRIPIAPVHQCLRRTKLNVSLSQNWYYASPYAAKGSNICNRRHQWNYTWQSGARGSPNINPSSCILGGVAFVTGDEATWYVGTNFANNWSFCARSYNTDTGNNWDKSACVTIHS